MTAKSLNLLLIPHQLFFARIMTVIGDLRGWGGLCHTRENGVSGGESPAACCVTARPSLCSPPLQVCSPAGELRPLPQGRPEVCVRLVQRRAQMHPPAALQRPLQPLARLVQPQRQVLQPPDHRGKPPSSSSGTGWPWALSLYERMLDVNARAGNASRWRPAGLCPGISDKHVEVCPHARAQPRVCLGVHVCTKEAEPAQPPCQASFASGAREIGWMAGEHFRKNRLSFSQQKCDVRGCN